MGIVFLNSLIIPMRLSKKNFLIQVKYSDLVSDTDIERYFLGFGGELYLSPEEIDNYDHLITARIKTFVKKNRFPLRLHAPITDIDYSRIHATISSMQSLYNKIFKLCKALDIDAVVAHAEFNRNAEFPVVKQFENAVSLWRILNAGLSVHDIHLNIENHSEVEPDYLIGIMEKIGSPYFGMCVDIGHSNAFGKIEMKAWLGKYPAGSIREVHLADNAGDDDTHLPLGEGNVDFPAFFEALEARRDVCVFVLEPRDIREAQKSLSFLRKAGFLE
ncbi:MAG: sugar phosphate isomerase/epimerase family protein [Candidatus Omnitrophota bacterium]